ncbi:Phage-related baseplate assembly protein [Paracoccus haematequi]|uniref:Phage-related baseplate assembly protein n=1 Tax=Paracoccus haematequi TaxID=2491866 RepID=A0A447IP04_9RHOB|nr:phage baseplate assembly protein V [Paracoccus haematequi]VDS09251.1 Phage-related baseplate assembly protein [Paracoccus haematequi]
MSYSAAENDRRTANILLIGKIAGVNPGTARARVDFGDLGSSDLPVGQLRAGALSFWWMPEIGEQVLVGCPGGDIAQGVILCSIFAGNAPSSDAGVPLIALAGGMIRVDGSIEVTGDVVASGISLVEHVHGGIQTGQSKTRKPE